MRQLIAPMTLVLALSVAPAFSQTLTIGADFTGVPDTEASSPGAASTEIDLSSPATTTGLVTSVHLYWSQGSCTNAVKIKFFRPSTNLTMIGERGPFTVPARDVTLTLSPPVSVLKGDVIGVTRLTPCGNPAAFYEQGSSYAVFSSDFSGPYEDGYNVAFGARLALRGTGSVPTPPAANFTVAPPSPIAGQSASFTDTSTGVPTAWEWTFGDGSTSTAQNPTHTYGSAGAFTVSLRASNPNGANSVTKTVSVSPPATAPQILTFPATPQTIVFGQTSILSWSTTNATTASISGVNGSQPPNGSISVSPSETTTYTLTASGSGGSATATETVLFGAFTPTLDQLRFAFTVGRRRAASHAQPTPSTTPPTTLSNIIFLPQTAANEHFSEPVSAAINDVPFTEAHVKDDVLTLSGEPGGQSLEEWLPHGGTARVSITNGDQAHVGVTLSRTSADIQVEAQSSSVIFGDAPATSGVTIPVRIEIYQPTNGANIDPNAMTWIVIHGFLDSSEGVQQIAGAIKAKRPNDQVLLLDWSAGANQLFSAEQWIVPVGQWAAGRLTAYRFVNSSAKLNLVGHSWGSYVADELASRMSGGVNVIVGLDPGANDPINGAFNPGHINFGAHSQFSIAFHSSDKWGNENTPTTSDEAFSVGFFQRVGDVAEDDRHSWIKDLFTSMVRGDGGVSRLFTLDRLLEHTPGPWQPNKYQANEAYGSSLPLPKLYEGMITSGPVDRTPRDIRYIDKGGIEQTVPERALALSIASVTPTTTQTAIPGQPVTYSIAVVNQSGLPISGATVFGTDYLKNQSFTTTVTDGSGLTSYTTTVPVGALSGTYSVNFTAMLAGYTSSAQATRSITISISSTPKLNITSVTPSATQTLNQGESVTYTISVADGGGLPLSGASVTGFDAMKGASFQTITTNGSGVTNYTTTVPAGIGAGTYPITFTATLTGYASSAQVSRQVTVTTPASSALTITSTALDPATATVGVQYATNTAVAATGGTQPYSWSATGLPSGMQMNASNGALFGTPTVAGPFTVAVTVKDSSSPQKSASKNFPLTVAAATQPLTITSTALDPATATVGVQYATNTAVAATGGTQPYSWSATGLPSGMQMNASNGALFGTPTVAGPFTVAVTVKDSSSPQKSASKNFPLTVAAATQPLTITSTALDPATATVGVQYATNTAVAATGGTQPYS